MANDEPIAYALSDDITRVDYASSGSISHSMAPSLQTNITFATTATYKAPEPALFLLPREEIQSKDGVKVCMCCRVKKFGLFAAK